MRQKSLTGAFIILCALTIVVLSLGCGEPELITYTGKVVSYGYTPAGNFTAIYFEDGTALRLYYNIQLQPGKIYTLTYYPYQMNLKSVVPVREAK